MAWATLEYGDRGSAVSGLTRGLHYALGSAAASAKEQSSYDYAVQRDVMLLQRRARIIVDGVVGAATWTVLARLKKPSGRSVLDARAKMLIRRRAKTKPAGDVVRDRIVSGQNWLLAHRYQMPYAQVRPYPHFRSNGTLSTSDLYRGTDCSGSVTALCEYGGARDPNGLDYDGTGYTGTLRGHARATRTMIALSQAKRGDLTHYTDSDHVAQLHEDAGPGDVPIVFSFGSFPCGLYAATYRSIVMVQRVEV